LIREARRNASNSEMLNSTVAGTWAAEKVGVGLQLLLLKEQTREYQELSPSLMWPVENSTHVLD